MQNVKIASLVALVALSVGACSIKQERVVQPAPAATTTQQRTTTVSTDPAMPATTSTTTTTTR